MEDEAILLKIKRSFSKDESVAALLQMISQLRFEIGVLKSELHEIKHKPTQVTKTRKEWEKEPLFHEMKKNSDAVAKKNKQLNKDVISWRNQYFSILAKLNNQPQINSEELLLKFAQRNSTRPEQINNHNLPAGSPMYFYCKHCGHESDTVSEDYLEKPKTICPECELLIKYNLIK